MTRFYFIPLILIIVVAVSIMGCQLFMMGSSPEGSWWKVVGDDGHMVTARGLENFLEACEEHLYDLMCDPAVDKAFIKDWVQIINKTLDYKNGFIQGPSGGQKEPGGQKKPAK